MLPPALAAMRPSQWVKSAFVLSPLLFARKMGDPSAFWRSLLAAAAFSLLASAVYLLNDLVDREADRAHPQKRLRPIASGALVPKAALALAGVLVLAALSFEGWLGMRPLMGAGAYLVINIAYSVVLKRVPGLDVLLVASGFVLRVAVGAAAIDVTPSLWLLACTGALATFLALAKRRAELARVEQSGGEARAVVAHYRLSTLDWMLKLLAAATAGAYLAYSVSAHSRAYVGDLRLLLTVPFVGLGLGRYLQLIQRGSLAEDPTRLALRDPVLILATLSWIIVCGLALYL